MQAPACEAARERTRGHSYSLSRSIVIYALNG